jgi:alkylation response protein AidB-like acyl-CoA dehydrogenase
VSLEASHRLANLSSFRHKGITAFIVEADNPGLHVGRNEHKLGIRASSTCEVSFSDCIVPAEAVLGGVGSGYKIAIGLLNEGRIGIAFQTIGLAQGAFNHAMQVRNRSV